MFDKWFNQDINEVLCKRNRVVVVDESAHINLLKEVLPAIQEELERADYYDGVMIQNYTDNSKHRAVA